MVDGMRILFIYVMLNHSMQLEKSWPWSWEKVLLLVTVLVSKKMISVLVLTKSCLHHWQKQAAKKLPCLAASLDVSEKSSIEITGAR